LKGRKGLEALFFLADFFNKKSSKELFFEINKYIETVFSKNEIAARSLS
jgi:hypothetical protein